MVGVAQTEEILKPWLFTSFTCPPTSQVLLFSPS